MAVEHSVAQDMPFVGAYFLCELLKSSGEMTCKDVRNILRNRGYMPFHMTLPSLVRQANEYLGPFGFQIVAPPGNMRNRRGTLHLAEINPSPLVERDDVAERNAQILQQALKDVYVQYKLTEQNIRDLADYIISSPGMDGILNSDWEQDRRFMKIFNQCLYEWLEKNCGPNCHFLLVFS